MNTALKIVHNIAETRQEIAAKELELTGLNMDLRTVLKDNDDAIRADLQKVADEARDKYEDLASQRAAAAARKASIEAAWDAGDGSVSEEEAAVVDKSIRRLTGLEKAAQRVLIDARNALEPFLADNHAAYYAADVIQMLTHVPVLVCKRPLDAPELSPAIILSQTTPTEGYGTFNPSGKVAVKVIGDPGLDWRTVRQAFEDTGSDATVSSRAITLGNIVFEKPILSAPYQHAVRDWADNFAEVFASHVRSRGYLVDDPHEGKYRVRGTGFAQVLTTDVSHAAGTAVGTVTIALGIGDVPFIGKEDFSRDAQETLSYYKVGDYTAAGVVTRYELVGVERTEDEHFKVGVLEKHPPTYIATLRMHTEFQPVAVSD